MGRGTRRTGAAIPECPASRRGREGAHRFAPRVSRWKLFRVHLPQSIAELLAATRARVGLCVIHVSGAPRFAARENEVFAQASAIKAPILWTLHRMAASGELSLDETAAVDPTNGAGGCGVLQSFSSPATRIALRDLAVLMIVLSDNVATNLLIDRLGFDAVNELIADFALGDQTRLRRKMIDHAARAAGRENTATPEEAARLMLRLGELADAGDAAANATLATLRLKKDSPVTDALRGEPSLATKPGMLDGIRTEWSLVESGGDRYAMALMADGSPDAELKPLFRDLATAIHDSVARAG